MKRLWVIWALLLAACGAPSEPPPPTERPAPSQPTQTPTLASPTDTPTHEPTETPSGLSAWIIDANRVEHETAHTLTDTHVDIRPELEQAGLCGIDCAGRRFASEDGMYDFIITMIAFDDEQGPAALIDSLDQDALASGATEIDFLAEGLDVQYLPEGSHIVYLDKTWSAYAQQGNIFIGAEIILYAEVDGPMPHDEMMSFSVLASWLAAAQIEALVEAGY